MNREHLKVCSGDMDTCDNFHAHQRNPSEPRPELPFIDSDWFRNYYKPDQYNAEKSYWTPAFIWENHELCNGNECSFAPGRCDFHPVDCDCSNGMCQDTEYALGCDAIGMIVKDMMQGDNGGLL